MAGALRIGRAHPGGDLPLGPEPRTGAVALDQLGQRLCGGRLAHHVDPVLLVRREVRQLQQDLRLAWSRRRFHDLDVALLDHDPSRRGARRRDGAPDRARHNYRPSRADGPARGVGRRHDRSPERMTRDIVAAPSHRNRPSLIDCARAALGFRHAAKGMACFLADLGMATDEG
jgi:hypothetical protein